MLSELIAAAVGAIFTAAFGLLVYLYRSKITYDLTSVRGKISLRDNEIVKFNDNLPSHLVSLEKIEIVNRGWKNIKGVELHLEDTGRMLFVDITSEDISPKAVDVRDGNGHLVIQMDELPRSAVINIVFGSYQTFSGSYRKLRGTSGAYKIVEYRKYRLVKAAIGSLFWYALVWCSGLLVGWGV